MHQVLNSLTNRGCRELPNVIYYSDSYRSEMAGKKRSKYANPFIAERIMGFPKDWTSPTNCAHAPEFNDDPQKFKGASLFSGVCGLELGLQDAFHPVLMCDNHAAVVEVLKKLQKHRHIPNCRIATDVSDVSGEDVAGVEMLCAGFPCPDICMAGS